MSHKVTKVTQIQHNTSKQCLETTSRANLAILTVFLIIYLL